MSDWQPMESAPKDGTHILAFTEFGVLIIHWMKEDYFRDGAEASWFPARRPTHWMPLPEPPR